MSNAVPQFPFGWEQGTEDEDPIYTELRRERAVCPVRLGDRSHAWLVTRYADIAAAMSDPAFSRTGTLMNPEPIPEERDKISLELLRRSPDLLINMDPPRHEVVRALIDDALVPRIRSAHQDVRRRAHESFDRMTGHSLPVDLISIFAIPFSVAVVCDLLDVPESDRDPFLTLAEAAYGRTATPDDLQRLFRPVCEVIDTLVSARTANPGTDLISAMATARRGTDRLRRGELLGNLLAFVVAGVNNTATVLGDHVVTLLRDPDQLTVFKQQQRPRLNAVEELLRFSRTQNFTFFRIAVEECELGGVRIKPGEHVIPVNQSGDRDERVHRAPHEMDITRQDMAPILSLGVGPHRCAAADLVRIVLEEALSGLFTRFPDLRLAVPSDQLVWQEPALLRALRTLPVLWTPQDGH